MAKRKDKNEIKERHTSNNIINKLATNVQKLLNISYMNNYYNSTQNRDDLDKVHSGIVTAMNNIISNNNDSHGLSTLTVLYNKITTDEKELSSGLKKIFEDDNNLENLISIYSENKYIKDMDAEIDTICTYMPQLEEALDILKENVLSSEQFNKEFMYMNNVSATDNAQFKANLDKIKTNYNLEEIVDDIYYKTSKYGEVFYYVKRYDEAFTDLLNNRNKLSYGGVKKISISENTMIYEENLGQNQDLKLTEKEIESISDLDIKVQLESDMFIREAVINRKRIKNISDYNNTDIKKEYDSLSPDEKFVTQDGLVDKDIIKNEDIKTNGSIVKELFREKILPIYIDNICMGYYYIDCDDSTLTKVISSASDLTNNLQRATDIVSQQSNARDNAIKTIAEKIAKGIDVNFINSNQNFKKELYAILKYNSDHGNNLSNIRVTYIPPEDIVHFYFRKDPKTHRGISDLRKSIIPAKLYTSLYISTILGIITRGFDKRAYYVKSSIDSNIANVMMRTMNEIKKGNFGMRDINNLNTFLNITGRFNDMIIPENQSGESPVRFEIMQGQDIPVKTELMEMLENMALNPTGVPLEAVQTRLNQVDFASQITMNNSKLLRKAYKRQTLVENLFSPFLTKIYNNEYGGNDVIEMCLPSPKYLNNQQVDMTIENALNTKMKYIDLAYGDNKDGIDPEEIDIFGNEMMRMEYAGVLPWDKIDKAKARARIRYAAKKKKESDI